MLETGFFQWLMNDQSLMSLLANNWLLGVGLIGLVIFVETGLVIMPFLPGDTLLFLSGAFLGLNGINPIIPLIIFTLAAVSGDQINYLIGNSRVGSLILNRRWVKDSHIEKTRAFYDKYGMFAIAIGRFIPIVRTVAPFLAGMTKMNYRRFTSYNLLGGVVWVNILVMSGVWLCRVEWIKSHISLLSLTIAVLSMLPLLFHVVPHLIKQRA